MLPRRQLRVLSVLAAFLALTQANILDAPIQGRQLDVFVKGESDTRSPSTSSGSTTDGSSSTTRDVSTTSSPSPTASPTTAAATSTTSSPSTTSTTPPSTSSTRSSPTVQTTTSTTQHTSASDVTVVVTDGNVSTHSTSSPSSTPTNAASLSGATSSSTGLSSKTKSTVIGVVVGVGGAILLAGLLVVVWRIWGRRKNEDESDGLMGFRTGSAGKHEKAGSMNGPPSNPFQSTLENYHNPARVNASSNF